MSVASVNYSSNGAVSPEPEFPSAQLSIRNVTKVFAGKRDMFSKLSRKASRDFTAIEDISLDIEIFWIDVGNTKGSINQRGPDTGNQNNKDASLF